MAIKTIYGRFPAEGEIIGRLIVEYTNLELQAVHNIVHAGISDFNSVIKEIYKRMGESKRLTLIRKIGLQGYKSLSLDSEFNESIDNIDYCRQIRNQYSHSIFWDDWGESFGFANLEDVAKQNAIVQNWKTLPRNEIDIPILHLQENYFEYTDHYFLWLINEAKKRLDRPCRPQLKPQKLARPPLCKPPAKYIR